MYSKKTALITGAGRRIGANIAIYLAKKKWNIVLHYNNSGTEAEAIAKVISKMSVEVELVRCDLSTMDHNIMEINADQIDLLINNASCFENDNISNYNHDSIMKHLKVNLVAPMLLTKLFVEKSSGSINPCIINLLDCYSGDLCNSFLSYKLSKESLAHFTKIAAATLAPKIRVNSIALGQTIRNNRQSKENFQQSITKKGMLKKAVSQNSIENSIDYILDNQNFTGNIIELRN